MVEKWIDLNLWIFTMEFHNSNTLKIDLFSLQFRDRKFFNLRLFVTKNQSV